MLIIDLHPTFAGDMSATRRLFQTARHLSSRSSHSSAFMSSSRTFSLNAILLLFFLLTIRRTAYTPRIVGAPNTLGTYIV